MNKRKFTQKTKEELETAINNSNSVKGVLKYLGIHPSVFNYKVLFSQLENFNIDTSKLKDKKIGDKYKRLEITDEQIIEATKCSSSFNDIIIKLRLNFEIQFNKKWVRSKIFILKLDISHLKEQKDKIKKQNDKIPLGVVCIKNSTYSIRSLKRRLIKEGKLLNECSLCGIKDWLGKDLTLIIDHVNGVNNDNRLENLRLVCPNCNSQLDTFCGRNTAKAKAKKALK
jgi:hypothetical protein